MKIDFAGKRHTEEIKRMWQYCFNDDDAFVNWFFEKVYKNENTLAVFDGERVAANLQLFYYDISVFGNKCPVGYIAGVAALPEYRGRGYVRALMNAAIEELYRRGCVYALLIPFRFDFYRPFGFEACYWLSEYTGGMECLRPFSKAKGEFREYGTPPINIYNDFVKDKNGYIIRNEEIFNEIYEDTKTGVGHFYILDSGGYIIYTIRDDTFYAPEIAYTGWNELKSLLGFVYSHSSQVSKFKIRTSDDEVIRYILAETNIEENRKPHVAARVLNAKKALELLGANDEISVLDSVIKENVIPGAKYELDVITFTRLSFGAMSPHEGEKLGVIQRAKDFEGVFKKKTNYINMLGWV